MLDKCFILNTWGLLEYYRKCVVLKRDKTRKSHLHFVFVVQLLSCVWLFAIHGQQHATLPCPSLSSEVCSNSYPLSQWCHSTISPVTSFSSCPQSFPASGSFPVSQHRIRLPKYSSFSVSSSSEYSGLISFTIDSYPWIYTKLFHL